MRILLSEGSSNSARQTLYGLGPGHQIDLLDPSPWCQCRFSSFVKRRIDCPPISKDPLGYAKRTAEVILKNGYDVLFPTHEQVYLFSKYREYFGQHIGLAVPDFDAIGRVQSKAEFAVLMDELQLPTPDSQIAASKFEILEHQQFPCYVKLVHSTASLGVQMVTSTEELRSTIEHFEKTGAWKEGEPIVLQQPGCGRQAVASAVFQHGRLVGLACADVLRTGIGGGAALRVSVSHPLVRVHVEKLGRELNWHGPISVEYFYDSDKQLPQYIEINPRVSETFNAELAGVPICDAVARISVGEHVESLPDAKPGVMTHNGFTVMIADAYNGASRLQLMKRLLDHWTNRGDLGSCESEITRLREDPMSLIPAIAVILRLLISPKSAASLTRSTVDNYSLPHAAALMIDALPNDYMENMVRSESLSR